MKMIKQPTIPPMPKRPTFDARDTQYNLPIGTDLISRQAAIDALKKQREELLKGLDKNSNVYGIISASTGIMICTVGQLPSAQPEIIRCKDCKHNPKLSWFGCPMSHLSEAQRPETAWCWKAERREVTT